jgi:hypothetical protein
MVVAMADHVVQVGVLLVIEGEAACHESEKDDAAD